MAVFALDAGSVSGEGAEGQRRDEGGRTGGTGSARPARLRDRRLALAAIGLSKARGVSGLNLLAVGLSGSYLVRT